MIYGPGDDLLSATDRVEYDAYRNVFRLVLVPGQMTIFPGVYDGEFFFRSTIIL